MPSMQSKLALTTILAVALLLGCQDHSATPTAPGATFDRAALGASDEADVEFGIEEGAVGSPFPPAEHDQSFHAFDKVRPRTVVISRGGSVTYEIYPCHQPAVYAPGTDPDDIDVTATEPIGVAGCPPDRIVDPTNRLAVAPPQSSEEQEWTHTFDEPGRYLVICTTTVHFVFAKMYSWVIVQ